MRAAVSAGPTNAITRLAAMPGKKRLAVTLAVAAAAVAISACGSSSSDQTIDPADAQKLQSALDGVQSAINARRCNLAQHRADDFVAAVNELPESVGTDDKETLRAAGENLVELAGDENQCKPTPITGASGPTGAESTTSSTTSTIPLPDTETTTTSTTTSTSEPPPEDQGGGNDGTGGGPPSDTGGGPPSDTGGGPPSDTGGGGGTGGGTGGTGGGTGTGGTGTGGGGGTG